MSEGSKSPKTGIHYMSDGSVEVDVKIPVSGILNSAPEMIFGVVEAGAPAAAPQALPLLRQRTVVMILTRLENDTIRVNVIPRKLTGVENDALTTPLSVAGGGGELDAKLPSALTQFVGAHLELRNTLESAKEQMAAAADNRKAMSLEGDRKTARGPDRANGG